MIHLSSYHSNGLPAVVWSNRVNLIGEKVYKPKIHFCEHCNKPILIYGRLIPCKHIFCYSCANLCITSPTATPRQTSAPDVPQQQQTQRSSQSPTHALNYSSNSNNTSYSNNSSSAPKSCHRCNGRVFRVERNTLNSIFVCQIETCKRTYLSARDLQAHVSHRHSKKKPTNSSSKASASVSAISSSPYISSSSLAHLNTQQKDRYRGSGVGSSSHHHQHNNQRNQRTQNHSHNSTDSETSKASNHNNNHNHSSSSTFKISDTNSPHYLSYKS